MNTLVDNAIKVLESTNEFKIVKIISSPTMLYNNDEGVDPKLIGKGLVIDTETTGLSHSSSKIINLAAIQFTYNKETYDIYRVVDTYNGFSDPGESIPPMVSTITQIDNQMVSKKSLNIPKISDMIKSSDFIVAHNAKFDRPFVDSIVPASRKIPWVCSLEAIPWYELGFATRSLGYISYELGFTYSSHLAFNDTYALLEVLSHTVKGNKLLKYIVNDLNTLRFKISAIGAAFEKKDSLKDRDYHWDAKNRNWFTVIKDKEVPKETEWLKTYIYVQNKSPSYTVKEIDRINLYK